MSRYRTLYERGLSRWRWQAEWKLWREEYVARLYDEYARSGLPLD